MESVSYTHLDVYKRQTHVCVLDSDTVINREAFHLMVEALQRDSRIGVVGPTMMSSSGDVQHSGRNLPTFAIKVGKACPFEKLSKRAHEAEIPTTPIIGGLQDVGYLLSACWLMPKSTDVYKRQAYGHDEHASAQPRRGRRVVGRAGHWPHSQDPGLGRTDHGQEKETVLQRAGGAERREDALREHPLHVAGRPHQVHRRHELGPCLLYTSSSARRPSLRPPRARLAPCTRWWRFLPEPSWRWSSWCLWT